MQTKFIYLGNDIRCTDYVHFVYHIEYALMASNIWYTKFGYFLLPHYRSLESFRTGKITKGCLQRWDPTGSLTKLLFVITAHISFPWWRHQMETFSRVTGPLCYGAPSNIMTPSTQIWGQWVNLIVGFRWASFFIQLPFCCGRCFGIIRLCITVSHHFMFT